MSEQPRAYTAEEVRDMLLGHIRNLVDYWTNLPDDAQSAMGRPSMTVKDRVEGAAFSILVALDGNSGGFPCAITLKLDPHPEDKQYHQNNGENWIEPGMEISDMLHDHFYKRP